MPAGQFLVQTFQNDGIRFSKIFCAFYGDNGFTVLQGCGHAFFCLNRFIETVQDDDGIFAVLGRIGDSGGDEAIFFCESNRGGRLRGYRKVFRVTGGPEIIAADSVFRILDSLYLRGVGENYYFRIFGKLRHIVRSSAGQKDVAVRIVLRIGSVIHGKTDVASDDFFIICTPCGYGCVDIPPVPGSGFF